MDNSILSSSYVNWDFVDDLFYHGCWSDTGPEFFNPSDYTTHNIQENQSFHCSGIEELVDDKSESVNDAVDASSSVVLSEKVSAEANEIGRERRIGQSFCSVQDRLRQAMEFLKSFEEFKDVLIQTWMPVTKSGKIVLTTIDQPYILTPNCENLAAYRKVSEGYEFPVNVEDHKGLSGFPARVFLEKLPEWTPDVRFFRNDDEYPRKYQANQYKIRGSLAVPILERGSATCLAIFEIVTSTPMINYRPELDDVCKALEAVGLKSSQDFCPPGVKCYDQLYRVAVPELSTILKFVCKTYNLPLALTWSPCHRQGKNGCRNLSEKFSSCISTVRSACFVADRRFSDFFAAATEQFLFVGQRIAGRVFSKRRQCFAADVTAFSKTSYPLSHHTKMYGLRAAVAIPLLRIGGSLVEFVRELFLPKGCQDIEEQKYMCDLLTIVIQQSCRSLLVVMDKEPGEESEWKFQVSSNIKRGKHETDTYFDNSSWIDLAMEAQKNDKSFCFSLNYPKTEPIEEFKVTTYWNESSSELNCEIENRVRTSYSLRRSRSSDGGKPGRKRRGRIDKTISLQDLRQYYAGSLKDAAKSIGVCPTTLKRICRKHGIARWPSRKIKKVGESLKKLQKLIDSVQGANGAIEIGSFYSAFPELSSPKTAHNGIFSAHKIDDRSTKLSPPRAKTSTISHFSNRTMSYSGSTCCSKEHPAATDGLVRENVVSNRTPPSCPEICGRSLKEGGGFRAKASYGNEKVRLTLQPEWSLRNLQHEIANRFELSDLTGIELKYMDEDGEMVRLTCESDLEECKDVFRYSNCTSIQIFLSQVKM